MKKYRAPIILGLVVLIAAWCFWYARPVDIYQLTGIPNPDSIDILVDRMTMAEEADGFSSFRLEAGEEEMNNVLQELEALRFRRNPVDVFQKLGAEIGLLSGGGPGGQFEPDLDYEAWISFHKGETRSELRYFGNNWRYQYRSYYYYIPVSVENGLETGRELGAFLYEIRQQREQAG